MQHVARHVRAVVRREEDVARGHLRRRAGPAQWDVRAEGRHLPKKSGFQATSRSMTARAIMLARNRLSIHSAGTVTRSATSENHKKFVSP